jgi:hypothetical protein
MKIRIINQHSMSQKVLLCDNFAQGQWKLNGRGNLCSKEGKILHSASANKSCDTIYKENSYWTDEEI